MSWPNSCQMPSWKPGRHRWWLALLLLLCWCWCQATAAAADAKTAYLVASQQQAYEASNSSFNTLRGILQRLDQYDTVVLTEDYSVATADTQSDPGV